MSRARQLPPALLCACAMLAAGCGGSDTQSTKFIAKSRAADFQTTLDALEQDVEADRCDQAASGIVRLRAQVDEFPNAYDTQLVLNVSQWIDHIDERLELDCGEAEETPTPGDTPDATPEPEDTVEPTPTSTPAATETASPEPTTTPEPEVPEVPTAVPPADDGTGGAPGEDEG